METTILYHVYKISDRFNYPCPDGLAAAWVALKKYPEAFTIGCWYPDSATPFNGLPYLSNKNVIIVDFSVHPEVIKIWESNGCDLTIIDHHQTAIAFLSSISSQLKGKLDIYKCGAVLTWEYFFPERAIPDFLYLVQERDCGDLWALPQDEYWESDASYFHKFSSMRGRSYGLYDELEKLTRPEIVAIAKAEVGDILKEKRDECAKNMNNFKVVEFEGYSAGYITLSNASMASDLGKMWVDLHGGIAIIQSKDKISLRSSVRDGNIDVGAIAQKYGGGGHKHAAGFTKENFTL